MKNVRTQERLAHGGLFPSRGQASAPGRGCSWLSWQPCWRWRRPRRTAECAKRTASASRWRSVAETRPSSPPSAWAGARPRYVAFIPSGGGSLRTGRGRLWLNARCPRQAPVYSSHQPPPDQNTCNGDWSYEVTHIDGCPEAVTYPVARDCKCQVCNPEEPSMHCGYHPVYNPSCPSM